MSDGAAGRLKPNSPETLKRLEAAEQRVLGAREALQWEREFIEQWKKEGLDTTPAEQLLSHLECKLTAAERECRTVREELGKPLDDVAKARSGAHPVTVRTVGIRVEN